MGLGGIREFQGAMDRRDNSRKIDLAQAQLEATLRTNELLSQLMALLLQQNFETQRQRP